MTRVVLPEKLGRGWSLPLLPDDTGRSLPWASGSEKVLQSILIILDTEPGERVMRPTFGCGLRRYLMQPNTATTRALIQREVNSALTEWEPRIELVKVTVSTGNEPSLVLIHIEYVHMRDSSPGSLVYPFYLDAT